VEQSEGRGEISMKMARMTLVLSGVAFMGAVAAPAMAQPPPPPLAGATPPAVANNTNIAGYGTAGCGLGSMLFGKQPGMIQVLAATTNGVFGTQTFGISSGTSNCIDNTAGPATSKAFIETNREAVAKDISRGQGETISSLSVLAGCPNSKLVGAVLQSDFAKIFPNASVTGSQAGDNVLQVLRGHRELACKNLT
jgi:Protein of unknown function (DUF3015)